LELNASGIEDIFQTCRRMQGFVFVKLTTQDHAERSPPMPKALADGVSRNPPFSSTHPDLFSYYSFDYK
jgi:hypothetical protein